MLVLKRPHASVTFISLVWILAFVEAYDGDLLFKDVTRNCTGADCIPDNEDDQCPPDSKLDKMDNKCVCDKEHCFPPVCKIAGQTPQLQRKASKIPGDCCDVFECTSSERDCSNVECPSDVGVCPDDSYRLPAHFKPHDCCATPQVCECYPKPCPQPICDEGKRVVVARKGNGTPGSCCDVFQCLKPNESCIIENTIHKNGTTWLNGIGINCTCINGLMLCNEHEGDVGGCRSLRGELHGNGESWMDDDCTACHCDKGRKKCRAFMCASCENPVQVPGECCPKCGDVPDSKAQCPDVNTLNCSLTCPNGLQRDEKGCYVCLCRNRSDGFCVSSSGVAHEDGQIWLDGCRQCICRKGIEMCSLVICPPLNCVKPIFHSTSDCCAACPEGGNDTSTPKAALCYSLDGSYKREGDSWKMGPCTRCICHLGQALCETRQCPPTPCPQPVTSPDLCCPYCPERHSISTTGFPCSPHRDHLSTWRRGVCESCICEDGKTICYTEHCPVPNCSHPVLAKDQCCSICIGSPDVSHCRHGNMTMSQGDSWITDECNRCRCREEGAIECVPVDCNAECGSAVLEARRRPHCCHSCQAVRPSEPTYLTWLTVVMLLVGIIVGVLVALAVLYCRKCCANSIFPVSGCNEALTSFTRSRCKFPDLPERAKLTSQKV